MILFRPKILIIVATVLSLIATFVVYLYLEKQKDSQKDRQDAPQPVIIAAVDLTAGLQLEEKHLKKTEWPKNILPAGTFSSIADLIGRVTKTEIVSNEPILEAKLAMLGSAGGFSSLIPQGMRALTVSVNVVSGVSGFILPNAHVDVLVTVSSMSKKEESSTKTILEDVQVLAVDQTFERDGDDPVKVQSVTLLVTPSQAEKLALASTEGKLQLVLRNSADRNSLPTDGVQLKELITGNSQPAPQEAPARNTSSRPAQKQAEPPPTHTVEIIRANKREEVKFEKTPEEAQPPQPENP